MIWPPDWERQMGEINSEVNQLPYVSDALKYNKDDFWASIEEAGSGDCDDYAIGKLRRLVVLGWPLESLHLACCYVETGEYHAVLVVDTPVEISYMLDNRFETPIAADRLKEIRYRPDIIQAVGGKPAWREWKFSGSKGGWTNE